MVTKSNIKDVSLTGTPDSVNLCQYWPATKKGLQVLEQLIKNPIVKGVIDLLIKTGDVLCPGS